jgi:hypothetical protein
VHVRQGTEAAEVEAEAAEDEDDFVGGGAEVGN